MGPELQRTSQLGSRVAACVPECQYFNRRFLRNSVIQVVMNPRQMNAPNVRQFAVFGPRGLCRDVSNELERILKINDERFRSLRSVCCPPRRCFRDSPTRTAGNANR